MPANSTAATTNGSRVEDVSFHRPQVCDLHDFLCCNETTKAAIGWRMKWRTHAGVCIRFRRVEHRDCAERIVLVKKHVAEVGAANADRILKHGLEYRLQITRGTADDLEHVRCGCLLFQRLAQFAGKPSDICLRLHDRMNWNVLEPSAHCGASTWASFDVAL